MSLFSLDIERAPDWHFIGAEIVAPTAGQVMVTSPGLIMASSIGILAAARLAGDDSVPTFELVHRDAANSVDIDTTYADAATAAAGSWMRIFLIKSKDLIVLRAKTAGTVLKIYQAELFLWRI